MLKIRLLYYYYSLVERDTKKIFSVLMGWFFVCLSLIVYFWLDKPSPINSYQKKIELVKIDPLKPPSRNIFSYKKATAPRKRTIAPKQNQFIDLRQYSISGMMEVGNARKAFVKDSTGSSHYVGVGSTLNRYRIIDISSDEITCVDQSAQIEQLSKLLADKEVIKYVISK